MPADPKPTKKKKEPKELKRSSLKHPKVDTPEEREAKLERLRLKQEATREKARQKATEKPQKAKECKPAKARKPLKARKAPKRTTKYPTKPGKAPKARKAIKRGTSRLKAKKRLNKENKARRAKKRAKYTAFLRSDEWKVIREGALERAGHKCERCGSKKKLQCHHRSYARFGGRELPKDLEILCKACHRYHHATTGAPKGPY